jgi:hypothetical protein
MTYINNDNISPDNEVTLRDLILRLRGLRRYLKHKWKIILIASLAGALLGLVYSYFKKTIYKAELSFALQDDNSSGGGLGGALGLASQFGLDLGSNSGGGAFSGDNLLELIKSRSMVEETLLTSVDVNGSKQTLAELYATFNKFHERWTNIPQLKNVRFLPDEDRSKYTLQQDSILGDFYHTIIKNNLSVDKLDKKLSIITVKVNSKNELFSKSFAEILVKTVSDFYINTKTKRSSQNVNILQRQTDSVRRELNSAITGVATTSDVNPNPNPSLQIIRVPSQRMQVDVQADIAILTELVKNLELSKMSLRKETPLIQIIDRPILPLEKDEVGKLKGIIIGLILGAFLAIVMLLSSKIFKNIMSTNT